jgi:hypothetical protein
MKWISVKERLPELDRIVMAYRSECIKAMITKYRTHGDISFEAWTDGNYKIEGVTHWMPLPEPPKED